jgi:phosphohistidine phosphatase
MRIYLVQHGQAKSEDEDPERPLTDQGVGDVTGVARYAVDQLGVRPARVVHSGKTRARQTAEIWGGLLGSGVEHADALAPKDDPSTWAARIDAAKGDVMLVGHLPHLARLAGLLLTGDKDQVPVTFQPGAVVGLEDSDAGWTVWLVLPPRGA